MSGGNNIHIQRDNRICILTINNPEKRNVLSTEILLNITQVLNELRTDPDIRCIIITGAGEKAFSSGYDISSIGDKDMLRDYEEGHPLVLALRSIEEYPYPVVAMINGHAFGAGLELAVTCDIRVCSEHSKLGMPPSRLGVAYTYTGIRKFLNLIGTGNTKEMFLTGNPVDARRAERIGLVNHLVKKEELEEFTHQLATTISENAPLSMESIKTVINQWQENQELSDSRYNEVRSIIEKVQNSNDYKEGQKAFQQKRKPQFTGK